MGGWQSWKRRQGAVQQGPAGDRTKNDSTKACSGSDRYFPEAAAGFFPKDYLYFRAAFTGDLPGGTEAVLQNCGKNEAVSALGDEETVEYVMEFFNIVYGTAISAYNRQKNTAIRFGIQDWLKEAPWPREGEYALWERYQSEAGHLRILYQYKKV